MRALFWIVGLVALGFSVLHWFVTYEHWHQLGAHRASALFPACVAVVTAVLAIWCLRRAIVGARTA